MNILERNKLIDFYKNCSILSEETKQYLINNLGVNYQIKEQEYTL